MCRSKPISASNLGAAGMSAMGQIEKNGCHNAMSAVQQFADEYLQIAAVTD